MPDHSSLATAYADEARRSFRGYKRMAEGALSQLSDEQFFHVPDPESNSIAVLVKHIAGNTRSRWTDFLTSDGEKPDRNRDQEFDITPADTRADLMRGWEASFNTVFTTLQSLTPEDFDKTLYVRGEAHSVLQAVNRSLNHVAHHIGQIVFLAKLLRGTEWKTLSIPKGKSAEYNSLRPEDRRVKAPTRG
jgi:uncharacterized damage-inducible protein DinB